MKVAYVGNHAPAWSTETDVGLAFEALGHEVIRLQENQLTKETLMQGALNSDLLLITGTWEKVPGPNYCASTVSLDDALDVFHECVLRGIPTATYHLDVFWGVGRGGRRWWTHPMMYTSHVFTADGDHEDEWRAMGVNHHWLPAGVRHTATEPGTFRPEYACDVAFVGSNGVGYHEDAWPYRRELVDQLRAMCQRNGLSFKNPGGDSPKVDRGDMNDFYASAKVTVGDSLCLKRESALYFSDRSFEAPGRGGYLIMPRIGFLSMMYDSRLPMYEWGNWDQLEIMIGEALEDDEGREATRKACHEIAVERHTYVHRMRTLLETIGLA